MGEIAAWQIGQIAAMFGGGQRINIEELNPYRVETPTVSAAKVNEDKKRFWAHLGVGLFGQDVFSKRG